MLSAKHLFVLGCVDKPKRFALIISHDTKNSCQFEFSKMLGNQQDAGMTERTLVSGGLVSVVRIAPVVLKRLFVAGSLVCSRGLSVPTLMIMLPWIVETFQYIMVSYPRKPLMLIRTTSTFAYHTSCSVIFCIPARMHWNSLSFVEMSQSRMRCGHPTLTMAMECYHYERRSKKTRRFVYEHSCAACRMNLITGNDCFLACRDFAMIRFMYRDHDHR